MRAEISEQDKNQDSEANLAQILGLQTMQGEGGGTASRHPMRIVCGRALRAWMESGEIAHHSGVLPHPAGGMHGFVMPGFDSYAAMNGAGDVYHAGTMWDKQQRSASHLSQLFMPGTGAEGMDAYSGMRWSLPPGMVPGPYVDAGAMQQAGFAGGVWGGAPSGMYMGQSGNYEMAYPPPNVGYHHPPADGSQVDG